MDSYPSYPNPLLSVYRLVSLTSITLLWLVRCYSTSLTAKTASNAFLETPNPLFSAQEGFCVPTLRFRCPAVYMCTPEMESLACLPALLFSLVYFACLTLA